MQIHRLASVSILLLATVGCSNNETPIQPTVASGGSASTVGGSGNGGSNTQQGGSNTQQGGAIAQGGSNTQQGGASNNGGATQSGGNANTGGVTSNGGSSSGGAGGSPTGGTTSKGGSSSGGAGGTATGGATNKGGTSSTGGSSTGASSNGGSNTGGSNVGGSSVGGASTGGTGTSAGGANVGGSNPGTLNGCKATISDATLTSEYTKWKTAYVRDCSTTVARVQAGGSASGSESAETFSEGIGYGMLLAVAFNDQATFDKLWAYYKAARNTHGLMNWKMNACTGNYYDANGASDGDLDTAMALVQADRRWGGYTTDTNALLDAIRTYETMVCGALTLLRPGDAWGLECTTSSLNPSYFAPGYYRAFAQYQASQATFWTKFADDTITLLLKYQATATDGALMGEWSSSDKLADTSYGYNACRTPWRVAVDYVWWGTEGAKTYLTKVSTYVDAKGGVASTPFDKNSAYLGPFALSGIATGKCDAYYQSWMTGALYDDRYFQGTLRVLAMALMAGKFTF